MDQFFNAKRERPRLVAEADGKVVGWAACGSFSSRPVYSGVAEHSVYVASSARGLGVGRTLLSAFLEEAEAARLWLIESRIFQENRGSLALHLACGFRVVGRYNRMGKMPYGPMQGQWRDCIIVAWRSALDPDESPSLSIPKHTGIPGSAARYPGPRPGRTSAPGPGSSAGNAVGV